MNLTDQILSGVGQIHITDSLGAPLSEIKISKGQDTITPNTNELIVYVDKNPMDNPTSERKQFVFELSNPLNYYNQISDEFSVKIKVKNNDVFLESKVKRNIEVTETGFSILENAIEEVIEGFLVNLFEGQNYIYTNYGNVNIEVVYPKDDELNRRYLNNAIYYNHKINNNGEFSLDDIYFKDAFTKTEDKLNIEVDNATVSCITSKNNKFSLDEEGNLVVNSIMTNNDNTPDLDEQSIVNLIYPVGSIYMSINSTTPSTLFGGTWEQLKDRFLLGAGDVYSVNAIGGEASHILSIDELPSHTHNWSQESCTNPGNHTHDVGADKDGGPGTNRYTVHITGGSTVNNPEYYPTSGSAGSHTHTIVGNNSSTGAGQSHNNMPPYLAVYMWKRIS